MRVRCRLRDIRGDRKLTDVAAEAGVNQGTLSQIERGERIFRDKHREALERAYGAPVTAWYPDVVLLALEPEDDPT